MTENCRDQKIGAIPYVHGMAPETLMASFAEDLARRGYRVGGLLQTTQRTGRKRMLAVELDSGRQIPLSQNLGPQSQSCSLDPAALAEASGAVRRAVADRVDLVIVSKFSKLEAAGQGLAAELLSAMAEGLNVLTAVPEDMVGQWRHFTGGQGAVLPATAAGLWRWWGNGQAG
ncbi:DUF2478 domain-containing protein [Magnetospirillum aberrantis]|uniref:DUF2478 domain-containing protein n=1 Tax=Magnetospirillum aberrantis SpK TaxID=908842 RepID=A0A7C9QVP4_9PROT|nr:DUF2478 domain-containing protein [Magnetospirillum aberrantis]NFV81577.1 DUF2478 domain-containing protein [Magnetospirillum aberrantis SpK]